MPGELAPYFEKGFFGLMSLMLTSTLAAFGWRIKSDKEFRKSIHMKVDKHIKNMIDHQNAGGDMDWADLLHKGKIKIDNTDLKRKGPKGVISVGFRLK